MIQIKNIQKTFGKNTILRGIDLDITKGQVVVILGTFRLRQNHIFTLPERAGNARTRHNLL